MRKILKIVLGVIVLAVVVLFVKYNSSITIISGFAAKSACSCTFIANRSLEAIEAGDNDIPMVNLASSSINYEEKSVTSSVFGLKKRTAVFREGVGCVLLPEVDVTLAKEFSAKPNRAILESRDLFPYGAGDPVATKLENVDYNMLDEVVSSAFDSDGKFDKRTRALLVVYKGQLIAEKYGSGITKETPLIGWSMTKSITSTVVGAMVMEGRVNLNDNHLFEAWQNDPRNKITLNNLLQMNSGLEWDENYNRMSDATKMLYVDADMSEWQIQKGQTGNPNESWYYSSGISNIISKYMRNQFGSHQEYLDYWYSAFIDKVGMYSMILETDSSGNYVGSSYSWATARDWAKMGLLYLNNGTWNGEQVFDKDWVNYVKTATNTSSGDYGGHFWLNAEGQMPNVPKDVFFMNGYQGQRVFIYPSHDLVVVRLGLTGKNKVDFNELLGGIQKALKLSE